MRHHLVHPACALSALFLACSPDGGTGPGDTYPPSDAADSVDGGADGADEGPPGDAVPGDAADAGDDGGAGEAADDGPGPDDGGGDADDSGDADDGDSGPPPEYAFVYAHSSSDLYRVDPRTLGVTLIAPFGWPSGADSMTDIALDRDGRMVGISFNSVYAVDRVTARCVYLSSLDRSFNGMSFLPDESDPDGPEILVAAALDGALYRLDPDTGMSTTLGTYGGGLTSSGDLVSARGFGTVATVKEGGGGTDLLVRVDPATGRATRIGDTGVTDIWGLGYWGGQVYGFTAGGEFVLIDVTTGRASSVSTASVSWWGAGVTTSAPNIPM